MADDPIEAEVRNLVRLNRQSNQIRRRVRAWLRGVLAEVYASIARHDPTSVAARYQAGRVAKLLDEVATVSRLGYAEIRRLMEAELVTLGAEQGAWAAALIRDATEGAAKASVGRGAVRDVLRTEHMLGLTLREWVETAENAFIANATRAIRNDVDRGVTGETIRRSVAGPVARKTRRHLDAIVRTAVTFTSNRAHMATYEANADVLAGVEFLATLDSRTTVICARWDGTVWKVGDPSIQRPPLHVNCRSQIVPVVDWKGLGLEPPARGTRASEAGQTTAETYEVWFRGLPDAKQNAIIGTARAELFRRRKISFRDMVTRDNRVIPIGELVGNT